MTRPSGSLPAMVGRDEGTDEGAGARHYRGAAGRSYHYDKRRLPESALPWVAADRARKLQRFVRPDDVVVEIGVGAGWNLRSLACRRRIGQDVADFLADDLGDQGIEFVGDPGALDDGLADVVVCHHVLEHVPSPLDTLTEIRRVLRPGGTLLLFVPYEVQRQFRRYDPAEPNHHLFAWNPQTLGALVDEAGFAVDDAGLGQYGYDRFAASLAARVGLGERGFRAVRGAVQLVRPVREVRVRATRTA